MGLLFPNKQNNSAPSTGFFGNPYAMQQLIGGLGLLTAKTRNDEVSANQQIQNGLQGTAQFKQQQSANARQNKTDQRQDLIFKQQQEALASKKAGMQQFRDLIGTKGGEHQYDMMEGETPMSGLLNTGSGYAGGDLSYKDFSTQVAGIEGMESTGLGLLNKNFEVESKAKLETLKNQQFGQFKNYKEQSSAKIGLRNAFDKSTATQNKSLDTFSRATDMIKGRGGFDKMTGADDTLLMKSLANMILPNESVMGDDIEIIKNQSGLPAYFKGMVAKLMGGGTLDSAERKTIYDTMSTMQGSSIKGYEKQKDRYINDILDGGFMPEDFLRQHHMQPFQGGLLAPPETPVINAQGNPVIVNKIKSEWKY